MKLIILSITYRGVRRSRCVFGEIVNGRGVISQEVFDKFVKDLGIPSGSTIQIG